MFQKKFRYMAAVLAVLMITQGSFTAFADEIGPGYDEQNKASTDTSVTDPANAWKKVNGVYVDNNGKTIEGALLRGISVAKWQGDIDWAKVAADDISFAFIKMMSYGYEGGYTMDPNYEKNMKGASDNGVQAAPSNCGGSEGGCEICCRKSIRIQCKVSDRCGCRVKIYPGAFGSGAHRCGKRIL